MATEGSAELSDKLASRLCWARSDTDPGPSIPEHEAHKFSLCSESQSANPLPCGHQACSPRRAGTDERLLRRSEPERSCGRRGGRDHDTRKEFFISPAVLPRVPEVPLAISGKHKMMEDREETRRRNVVSYRDDEDPGVLSDSENEEPIGWRIRNMSAFIRKSKPSLAFSSGVPRSQSCTEPVEEEEQGSKLRVGSQQTALNGRVGIRHSYTAGILLSSENSRSLSAPITVPDRKLSWRAPPLTLPLPRPERSVSPESNDSISEELNHFKPIVCSPCTPPKRLADGRLLQPAVVKATPRNLSRGLQKATSYEASPAVLQKWMQIELDRQNLRLNSKATSPIKELCDQRQEEEEGEGLDEDEEEGSELRGGRKLVFESSPSKAEILQRQSVQIRVPAVRYGGEGGPFRQGAVPESSFGGPEPCGGAVFLSCRQSFSPYTRTSSQQANKLVAKDSQVDGRRGRKREQKTKHLDPDRDPVLKRNRPLSQDPLDVGKIQQERRDRLLAMKLQKQLDRENRDSHTQRDTYLLRSWISSQNRRRRGMRRSRRISKKH